MFEIHHSGREPSKYCFFIDRGWMVPTYCGLFSVVVNVVLLLTGTNILWGSYCYYWYVSFWLSIFPSRFSLFLPHVCLSLFLLLPLSLFVCLSCLAVCLILCLTFSDSLFCHSARISFFTPTCFSLCERFFQCFFFFFFFFLIWYLQIQKVMSLEKPGCEIA